MRFQSDKIKFVAVDEPSSALDAEGELRRFGHLTKYADKIICMKDGGIAEMGTHTELMQIEGEYAKLYNIQASAFQDTVPVEV